MQLGWIDFSKTERNKILSVLDLLGGKETLDELGIAPIRDGFANLFFPGTSTIQTRAKYFFVVPYALKQLEKNNETNPNKILKELDAIEKQSCKKFLEPNKNESGVIGKNAFNNGGWVQRNPSSIYWAGLKKYGIFTFERLSITEYVRAMCSLKAKKTSLKMFGNRNDNAEENECDDKNAGDLLHTQFWKMPLYKNNWIETLSIKLTKEEASFLKNQIIENCKGSLLAYVLKNDVKEFIQCASFQDISTIIDKFPEEIKETYQLALSFSNFVYTLRVIYNVIISEEKNHVAINDLEMLKPQFSQLASIDIDYIMQRLEVFANPSLRNFLFHCKQYMLEDNIEELKKCITLREVSLKTESRAKTKHAGEFDSNNWFGGKELDYRFSNARTLVKDIMESEGKNDAQSYQR